MLLLCSQTQSTSENHVTVSKRLNEIGAVLFVSYQMLINEAPRGGSAGVCVYDSWLSDTDSSQ